ncbi:hypothetical protein L7F22_010802 [Adiantum nelumboides]|nr:hypothetical protein [Adiantum nelumboides]
MALNCAPMVIFSPAHHASASKTCASLRFLFPADYQQHAKCLLHIQLRASVATKPCKTPVEEVWKIKQRHRLKNQAQPAILQGARKSGVMDVVFHQNCCSKTIKRDLVAVKALQVSFHKMVNVLHKFLLCCKANLQLHMREHDLLKTLAAYDWLRSIPSLRLRWKRKTVIIIVGFMMASVLLMVGAPVTSPNPVTWALTEENLIFLEAWRTIDRAYIDKTFNGQSWFRYREDALRREPMNNREQTYAAIRKMLLTLEDPFTRFLEPEKFKTLRGKQDMTNCEIESVNMIKAGLREVDCD